MDVHSPDIWIQAIEEALTKNQLAQAQQEAITALRSFPKNASLWRLLGSIYSKQDHLTQAIHAFEQALTLHPEPTTLYALGVLYEQQHDWEKAIAYYQATVQLAPHFDAAFFALGSLYQTQNQHSLAEQAYFATLQCNPQHETAYYNLALLYQETQQYPSAFNCYEQVLWLNPNHLAACWNYASLLFARGDYKKAERYYQQARTLAPQEPDLARNYASVLYLLGKFNDIIEILTPFLTSHPEESEIYYALGLAYYHLDDLQTACVLLHQTLVRDPNRVEAYSNLNEIYARLQQFEQAQIYGRHALICKDQRVCATIVPVSITETQLQNIITAFDKKKVISFSLWGALSTYTEGALENARLAPVFYPGWICRFYCDASVPETVRTALQDLGAEVILMPPTQHYEGLFWRFQVAFDPTVSYFLCRDCDSRLNLREQAAVDAWLASGRAFHIMRDALIHSELILAGMWGGIANCLPTLEQAITTFVAQHPPHRWMDQVFLREYLWPHIKTQCLIHDAYFAPLFGALPFPEQVRHLPPVGQGFKLS